jgi:hypothetical protein
MRTVIVDADLPKRLQTELLNRGRRAAALSSLNLNRSLDPAVLDAIRDRFDLDQIVLVTGDDQMLLEHAEHAVGITVAVIDANVADGFTLDQWRREIVHRWAHKMVEQITGTHKRYGLRQWDWKKPRRVRRPPITLEQIESIAGQSGANS